MNTGICEHTIRELIRTPKYLVRAIVKSPLRIMPPLWDNVDFVAFSDEDLYGFILNKRPSDFIIYGLLREETRNTSEWIEAAAKHKQERERERDQEEFEKLKKKLEGGG